jgi:transcriptional regulator with XRE-family HTH domain
MAYTLGMNHHITNVRELRTTHGMSQEYLAQKLGISRPTLIRIEKGERPLTVAEDAKVRDLFAIERKSSPGISGGMRISVPQKNIEKFKQVLLYVLSKTAGKPHIGMTVLYKLLYFIDFDYYEKYEEQMMGLTYIKNHYGPTPREFVKVVEQMKKDGDLEEVESAYFKYEQKKFLPRTEPDLTKLNAQELEMVDDVLGRYGDKTAAQLTSLSHEDTPWAVAEDGENIEYDHAFYRSDALSVREYDPL